MTHTPAPFPTDAQIIEFVQSQPGKVGKREVARAFQLNTEQKLDLKKALRRIEREGKLARERGELILCTLSPKGFHEIGRAKLIDPTTEQLRQRGGVCWAHPAYARKHVFARNDRELICADLSAGGPNAR